jgi:hypothetical protein
MRTLQKFSTIGERPKDVPEGWSIWNAPRPLYGHKNWQGDFLHGRFYVAVEPDGDFADRFIKENISLDAWQIEYITEDEAINRIKAEYPEELAEIERMERGELISLFYDSLAMEGEQ